MDTQMFCFQCEQTAGGKGCMGKAGVCGKKADIAGLQDQLTGALIGLARATDGNTQPTENTYKLLIKGLFTTITNVNFNEATIRTLINEVHAEKENLVPNCSNCASPCSRNNDYDMTRVWDEDEDIRSLKSLILFGMLECLPSDYSVIGSSTSAYILRNHLPFGHVHIGSTFEGSQVNPAEKVHKSKP